MTSLGSVRLLLVESDPDLRLAIAQVMRLDGMEVDECGAVESVPYDMHVDMPCVVVCGVSLPGMGGLEWARRLHSMDVDLPVVLLAGQGGVHAEVTLAVQAMREGVYDYLPKPLSTEQLLTTVRRAAERRRVSLQVRAIRRESAGWRSLESTLLGQSQAMQRIRSQILALANTDADVLIYGETGTGKELVARGLHEHSSRRGAMFVALNCGGLTESLADTELFGHDVGSFTGASRSRVGKMEYADGGTLFLDEIESMPMGVQVKMLRALQERVVERVGANKPIPVDCRVVAAAKADLVEVSARGEFRADLYYRIGVALLHLPPLRDRREDIPLLFERFCGQAGERYGREVVPVPDAQLAQLIEHHWPGNVRELGNVADRYVLGLCGDGLLAGADAPMALGILPDQVSRFERALIKDALRRYNGEVSEAARSLGVPRQTLYDKMKRLQIQPQGYRAATLP
jgi:two-component system C4-dicarboxylate transport response regulator DctD